MSNYLPKARVDGLVERMVGDETIIYDTATDQAYSLNATAAAVWSHCDGTKSIAEIATKISADVQGPIDPLLVELALDQLAKDNLLANGDDLASVSHINGLGMSRREAIRKIGLASAAAVPMVMVMTVPAAAQGGSGALAANGDACTPINNGLCASNNCLPAGGASGICCAAGSSQANAPGYNLCTTDGSAAAFSFRCCSGLASPAGGAPCPVGEVRYICDPY